MGTVYLATQQSLDREVAIKVIKNTQNLASSQINEIRNQSRQDHPNVLKIYDALLSSDGGDIYLVTEYMQHGSLARYNSRHPLLVELNNRVVNQVGSALSALHQAGIIHCDIKPANILIDSTYNCRLADFGVSTLMGGGIAKNITGTPPYVAPERLQGCAPSISSDIYSMGVILHEMTSDKPFGEIVNYDLTNSIDSIVKKATAANPNDRYQTIDDLIKDYRDPASGPTVFLKKNNRFKLKGILDILIVIVFGVSCYLFYKFSIYPTSSADYTAAIGGFITLFGATVLVILLGVCIRTLLKVKDQIINYLNNYKSSQNLRTFLGALFQKKEKG